MNFRRACIAFGVLTLALAIAGVVTTPRVCGEDRGLGPVLALELSVTAPEVRALVNSPECAAALRENTLGDMLAFIPAFTGFLVSGALMVRRRHRVALLSVLMFLVAGLSDEVEDVVMLHILDMPMATFEWLAALFFAVRLKFLLLSLGGGLLGWAVRVERVLGAAMMAGALISLFGLVIDPRLLAPGTLVAWLGLLMLAMRWREDTTS